MPDQNDLQPSILVTLDILQSSKCVTDLRVAERGDAATVNVGLLSTK